MSRSDGSCRPAGSNPMEYLYTAVAVVTVATIYCVYAHYRRDQMGRLRKLRSRVAYMMWSAARRTKAG